MTLPMIYIPRKDAYVYSIPLMLDCYRNVESPTCYVTTQNKTQYAYY